MSVAGTLAHPPSVSPPPPPASTAGGGVPPPLLPPLLPFPCPPPLPFPCPFPPPLLLPLPLPLPPPLLTPPLPLPLPLPLPPPLLLPLPPPLPPASPPPCNTGPPPPPASSAQSIVTPHTGAPASTFAGGHASPPTHEYVVSLAAVSAAFVHCATLPFGTDVRAHSHPAADDDDGVPEVEGPDAPLEQAKTPRGERARSQRVRIFMMTDASAKSVPCAPRARGHSSDLWRASLCSKKARAVPRAGHPSFLGQAFSMGASRKPQSVTSWRKITPEVSSPARCAIATCARLACAAEATAS